ncbi:hypothetical protein DFS34DRAFT_300339 [Phlyctochytrium arcticum]|nr:hypothetical protein DFS34DRAFT_300339 [Phlyctochytrium arcticum]
MRPLSRQSFLLAVADFPFQAPSAFAQCSCCPTQNLRKIRSCICMRWWPMCWFPASKVATLFATYDTIVESLTSRDIAFHFLTHHFAVILHLPSLQWGL